MAAFDPETFEETKFTDHFTKLQEAYKTAFSRMRDRFDSTLVHAIDQQVLNESEPVYEDGFDIRLPDDPYDRLTAIAVEREQFEQVLERYVEELRRAHREVFELDGE